MFGIFMESLVIFKLYTGLKLLLVLSLISWVYLLFAEKERRNRLLFVYAPLLVPMGIITVYGFCRFFAGHRRIGTAVGAALIILCGRCVYRSGYISRAENLYHIPDTVIEICDRIEPENPDARVWAVMPAELIHFVRQYSSRINMPYGREMLVNQWSYYNAVYEAMEGNEIVDVEELLKATRAEYCQYIVLSPGRETVQDPLSCGLVLADEIDGYRIYEDPVTREVVESWQGYYEDEE